jgi:hypothetical protein
MSFVQRELDRIGTALRRSNPAPRYDELYAAQFKPPRKVAKTEGDHVWVFGSNTGIPMEQVTVTDPPAPKPVTESIVAEPSPQDYGPPDDWPCDAVACTTMRP